MWIETLLGTAADISDESPPARAVWIETRLAAYDLWIADVTARKGGVD